MRGRLLLAAACAFGAGSVYLPRLHAQSPCAYRAGGTFRVGQSGATRLEGFGSVDGASCPSTITANQAWAHVQFDPVAGIPNYFYVFISVDANPGAGTRTALVGTTANGVSITQLGFAPGRNVAGDFDGDGAADPTIAVRDGTGPYQGDTATGVGDIFRSHMTTGQAPSNGTLVMGDFDGDSRTELASFVPDTGQWHWLPSAVAPPYNWASAPGEVTATWGGGRSTDVPVPADYDGDGVTDLAFYRPTDRFWYILQSATRSARYVRWGGGIAGEVPVPADYDGDGRADVAFFRPTDQYWYILRSRDAGATYIKWGGTLADVPLPGDYDGDGFADVAFYRPSDFYWYVRLSSTGRAKYAFWGTSDAIPSAADYDGDGKTDVAFFRPLDGYWYLLNIWTGAPRYVGWVRNYAPLTHSRVPVSR